MPRWPAGLHAASGSGTAYGYRPIRPPAVPQRHYWRQTATALDASAQAVFPRFIPIGPQFSVSGSVGPQAAGETWAVSLVQVQTNTQAGQAPLLAQQVSALSTATLVSPPPPTPVQAWLSVAGVKIHLLAQSTQGGYDSLDLGGQVVRQGEAITVTWWLAEQFNSLASLASGAWFVVRGTRYALSVT